jgi:hypothetical protein
VHEALDVLDDHDRVVDDEARGQVRPNRVSVLIEKPNSFTNAKVPMSDTGKVSAVMSTLRQPWRNRKMTRMTSAIASTSVVTTSSTEARTASVVSVPDAKSRPGGKVGRRRSARR